VIIVSHMRKKEQVDILILSLPMKGGPGSWFIYIEFKKWKKLKFFFVFVEKGECVVGCPSYIIFMLVGECWFFLNDQHSPIIKKIQSSKSWFLKIALILTIENPLPRGVVDKAVNTIPEVLGIEPTMKHLRKLEND
jgi:hypothetical protein